MFSQCCVCTCFFPKRATIDLSFSENEVSAFNVFGWERFKRKKKSPLRASSVAAPTALFKQPYFWLLYENTAVCRGVSTGSLGLMWDWLIYISILKTWGNKYLIPCWISKFANL